MPKFKSSVTWECEPFEGDSPESVADDHAECFWQFALDAFDDDPHTKCPGCYLLPPEAYRELRRLWATAKALDERERFVADLTEVF
jgi:hypothetical protein